MKRLLAIWLSVVLGACGGGSGGDKDTGPAPDAGSLDGGADAWTPAKCSLAPDCEGKVALTPCQEADCQDGKCVAVDLTPGAACQDPALNLAECETGVCAEAGGAVSCTGKAPAPDGQPCGETFAACGAAAMCEDGVCKDPCDDGNPCTDDQCTADGCTSANDDENPCDDGNACTNADHCDVGQCVGDKVCECKTTEDCAAVDDGDPCNGTLHCKAGECKTKPGTTIDCPATGKEPCVVNLCDPADGKCAEGPAAEGTECDDGNACTTGDSCQAGACDQWEDAVCEWDCDDTLDEDGDQKTDCDDEDCANVPECGLVSCGNGACEDWEDCALCPEDCTDCPLVCGDGICGAQECATCPEDCEKCPGKCGNSKCEGPEETCALCPADCGECPAVCGDEECNGGEKCDTCPLDCGECIIVCGDKKCEKPKENCSTCAADCACEPEEVCLAGECCTKYCVEKECGDDGCGGVCGTCAPDFQCVDGICDCEHDCTDKECGNDGCGGTCGTCDPGQACQNGKCV